MGENVKEIRNLLDYRKIRVASAVIPAADFNIAADAESTEDITVTGVKLGDVVLGLGLDVQDPDLRAIARVSAADTVQITITNVGVVTSGLVAKTATVLVLEV